MDKGQQDKYREEARRKIEESRRAQGSRGHRLSGLRNPGSPKRQSTGAPVKANQSAGQPHLESWTNLKPKQAAAAASRKTAGKKPNSAGARDSRSAVEDRTPRVVNRPDSRTAVPQRKDSRPETVKPREKAELNERLRLIQRRRDRSRAIILSIIVLLVLGVTSALIYLIIHQRSQTANLQFIYQDSLSQSYDSTALIIRDEELIASDIGGAIEPVVAEGYYARVGQEIALVIGEDMDQTLKELDNIKHQISDLQLELIAGGKTMGASAVYDQIDDELRPIISEMRREIGQGHFQRLAAQDQAVQVSLDRRNTLLADIPFDNAMLDSLKAEASVLEQQLAVYAHRITSQDAGLVSFLSDGLEEELTISRAGSLNREELAEYLDVSERMPMLARTIIPGQAVLRQVTGVNQYFALMAEGMSYGYFTDRTHFDFYLPDEGIRLENVEIVRTEPYVDGVLVIARTDSGVSRLLGRRQVRVEIIAEEVKGLKVPLSAVQYGSDLGGTAAVMAVQNGYYTSVPVEVLASDDDFAIIRAADKDAVLRQGSLVVINPKSVVEGSQVSG